jgi:hypothetical protein
MPRPSYARRYANGVSARRTRRRLQPIRRRRYPKTAYLRGGRARSRFFDGLKLSVTIAEPGVGDTLEAPDDETVHAIAGRFRSLYNDHEQTSYIAVLNLLSRHAHDRQSPRRDVAVDELKRLRKLKAQALEAGLVTHLSSGQALTPKVLIETFINGHYLHKDERRMAVLEDLRGDVVLMFEFLSSLQRLSYVFAIGRAVVKPILETPTLLSHRNPTAGG